MPRVQRPNDPYFQKALKARRLLPPRSGRRLVAGHQRWQRGVIEYLTRRALRISG